MDTNDIEISGSEDRVKLPEISFDHTITPIKNYDIYMWLLDQDFIHEELQEGYIIIKQAQAIHLIDQVRDLIIINGEIDEKMKNYLENASTYVNYLIDIMLDKNNWNFKPMEKFLWINLMIACDHENRAIPYIFNSPYFTDNIIKMVDKNGDNCLTRLLKSKNVDGLRELLKYQNFDPNILLVIDMNQIPAIIYALGDIILLETLVENIPTIEKYLYSDYFGTSYFNIACLYSATCAEYLFKSKFMTKEYFKRKIGSHTCLMIVGSQSPKLLLEFMNSKYCDEEIVSHITKNGHNLLSIIIKEQINDVVKKIVNGKYSKYLINYQYRDGNYESNIILDCIENNELLEILLNSEHFNKDIVNIKINGRNIVDYLALTRPEILKMFLEYFDQEFSDDILILTFYKSIDSVYYIINSDKMKETMLLNKNDEGMNIIMLMLENQTIDNKIIDKLFIKYLSKELLMDISEQDINTFFYLCRYYPSKAIEILESEHFDTDIIDQKTKREGLMIHRILSQCQNRKLSRKLILNKCNSEILNYKDIDNNNLLLILSKSNPRRIKYILESEYCSNELFKCVNVNGENCFTLMLKNKNAWMIFRNILESKYCTKELLNHKNNYDEYPFLLACRLEDENIARSILESKYFDPLTFGNSDKFGINCFMEVCKNKNLELLKIIGDHELMTEDIFNSQDKLGNKTIIYALGSDIGCVKYILNHKYCSRKNIDIGLTKWMISNMFESKKLKLIIDSKLCSKELLLKQNVDRKNCLMMAITKDRSLAVKILQSDYCSTKLLLQRDRFGKNSLQLCVGERLDLIPYILESKYFTRDILLNVDLNGYNIAQLLFNRRKIGTLLKILKSRHSSVELLTHPDKYGKCIMTELYKIESIDKILKLNYITKETLYVQNRQGNTILHNCIIAKKMNEMEKILDSKKCSSELMEIKNNDGNTFLMLLIINNDNLLSYFLFKILDSVYCTSKLVCIYNNDYNNLLMLLSMRHENVLERFLSHNKVTEDIFVLFPFEDTQNNLRANPETNDLVSVETTQINDNLRANPETNDLVSVETTQINDNLRANPETNDLVSVETTQINDNLRANPETNDLVSVETTQINDNLRANPETNDLVSVETTQINDNLRANPETNDLVSVETTPLIVCSQISDSVFKIILDSKKCTNRCINYKIRNHSCLSYAVINKKYNIVKMLLDSDYDLTDSFKLSDENDSIISMATRSTVEIFRMLVESKYMDEKLILQGNKYGHNLIIYALSYNYEITKYLVNSKYWTDEVKYYKDIDNDFLLLYCKNSLETVKYLFENGKIDKKMLMMRNSMNITCAHFYVQDEKILKILLESEFCDNELIDQQDNHGRTCLHIACKNNVKSFELILESKYCSENLMLKQDNRGVNILMMAIIANPELIKIILESKYFTKAMLQQKDNIGNNCLMYIVRYNPKSIDLVIKHKYYTNKLLQDRNSYNDTCYLHAARYNGIALKYLMKLENASNDLLYYGHTDHGSCLTIAALYQPIGVKYILEWEKLSWKIINTISSTNQQNFVSIGCKYNSDVVKYAIESKYDITSQLSLNKKDPAIFLAAKYQPDAVKYILNSKYGITRMLKYKINDRTSLMEAYNFQPRSLLNIVNSRLYNESLSRQLDSSGSELIHKISKIYPDISTLKDIKNINLVHHDNVEANDDDIDICNICYIYKMKTVFIPCCHQACIGCSFKMYKCHQCRQIIKDKKILN